LPLKNTLFIYVSLGLNFLLGLAQIKLLTGSLSPGDVGLFFAAAGVALILGSLYMFGFPMVFPRYLPRFEAEGRKDRADALLGLNLLTFAIPTALTLLVVRPVAARFSDSPVVEALPAALLSHAGLFLVAIIAAYFAGLRRMHLTAVYNVLPLAIHVGLLYAFRDRMTVTLAFHLLALSSLPALAASIFAIRPRFRVDRALLAEIRPFWGFAVLTSVLSPFVLYVDRVVIAGTLPLEVLGLYMIARKIENAVSKALTIPLYTMAPELSFEWDSSGATASVALFRRFRRLYLALGVLLCVPAALFGKPIIVLLSSDAYTAAYPILLVLLLSVVAGCVYAPYALFARSVGRMDLYFYADLTWVLSYAAACALLVGRAGALGVAWAAVVASTTTMLFVLLRVRPRLR
jgi:O-antigen/teichoic acid export membrane protein